LDEGAALVAVAIAERVEPDAEAPLEAGGSRSTRAALSDEAKPTEFAELAREMAVEVWFTAEDGAAEELRLLPAEERTEALLLRATATSAA